MSFVFYDLETTGLSPGFDQILQFAAIRTDPNLTEIGRIDLRCRLQDHILPHPDALCITRRSIQQIIDPRLLTHYEMVRRIRAVLMEWSPSIFVGYNSLRFDEHFLRHALFQTLHPPYLTNTAGNCRADAMLLVQAASVFAPQCLNILRDERGVSNFKLSDVATSNGYPADQFHDAMGDTQAMLHLARCLSENAPECWSRFLRFANKAAVAQYIEGEESFVLTEFYFGRPYHFVVSHIGSDPTESNALLCLDLTSNVEWMRSLDDSQLRVALARSPKPLRRVRVNAAPILVPIDEAPETALHGMSIEEIEMRSNAIRSDGMLQSRLCQMAGLLKPKRAASSIVEDQIYDGFIDREDEKLLTAFHDAPWHDRGEIVDRLTDTRLRYFGRRLLYAHAPAALAPHDHRAVEQEFLQRLKDPVAQPDKWLPYREALRVTDERMASATPADLAILSPYRAHLIAKIRSVA